MGGQADDIDDMTDLCSIPLSYVDVNEESYVYKLTSLVQFIQNHTKLVIDNPKIISENVLKYYNKNNTETKGKTIYLLKTELATDINSCFPSQFRHKKKGRKIYSFLELYQKLLC